MRFLIVDDNPHDRELIRWQLQQAFPDSEFVEVSQRAEFEAVLAEGGFDLALTDYQLNWTDGLRVLRALRERFPQLPVVMVTGTGSEEVAAEGMKLGLSDYVLKGYLRRLPVAVQESLEKDRLRREREDAIRQLSTLEKGYHTIAELVSDYAYTIRIQ
ncbi:MAG: response regulator, partial [Anaerolineales bacterium]